MRQRSLFDPEPGPASFPSQRMVRSKAGGDAPGEAQRSVRSTPAFVPLSEVCPPAVGTSSSGIARLAAQAEELDQRNDVEYRDLPCRSLIAPVFSRRVPIDFSINPYRGCEFGCVYCYARYTHEFMQLEDWRDFEQKIFVKSDARDALVRDLRRLDLRGKGVAIGTATDPYQPAERRYGVTRSLLEVLAGRRGLRLSITTKSDLVARDIDLLLRIREANDLQVHVTINTPDYLLSRRIEPRAPRPDKRLAAVRALTSAGIRTGVFMMPVLPRITDRMEDVEQLIQQAKEAGAHFLASQVLFLRKCSKKRFFPFIDERFPELLPYYRRLYGSYHTESLAEYTRQTMAQIQSLKRKHGLISSGREDASQLVEDQLAFLDQ